MAEPLLKATNVVEMFGGMGAAICANPIASCCAINMLINCLCGGFRCCI